MEETDEGTRRWAGLRLALGVGQMTGATVSIVLLAESGLNPWSLGTAVATAFLTTMSVLLFGGKRP